MNVEDDKCEVTEEYLVDNGVSKSMMMAVKYSHECKHSIVLSLCSYNRRREFHLYDEIITEKNKEDDRHCLTSSVQTIK